MSLKTETPMLTHTDLQRIRDMAIGQTVVDGTDIYLVKFAFGTMTTRDEDQSVTDSPLVMYELYIRDPLREASVEHIGGVQFALMHDRETHSTTARIFNATIDREWRGRGLGKFLYKGAINDLFEAGLAECVQSDLIRSVDAERVWQSICRTSPGKVYPRGMRMGSRGHIYETRGPAPILRRPGPVRVRGHARRRR